MAKQYHVESLGVFGSYVRNEQKADSDLDLLVTFSKTPGLLRFIELENHLSDLLGIKVDLVMKDALKPNIGKHILREVVPVQKAELDKQLRVRKATPLEDYKMLIEFEDGSQKEIDLEPFLHGQIFEPIRNNLKMFQDVRIEGGTIAWANGVDIDPDVLYYDLKPALMEEAEVVWARPFLHN